MFTCQSVTEGRFVVVHFPPEEIEALTVCEVEVFANTGNKEEENLDSSGSKISHRIE